MNGAQLLDPQRQQQRPSSDDQTNLAGVESDSTLSSEELAKFNDLVQRYYQDDSSVTPPANERGKGDLGYGSNSAAGATSMVGEGYANNQLNNERPTSNTQIAQAPEIKFNPLDNRTNLEVGDKKDRSALESQDPSVSQDNQANDEQGRLARYIDDTSSPVGGKKGTGRFNVGGRMKKRAKRVALTMLVSIFAAVPLGIIGAIPHAIQSWIQERTSAITERAMDRMGQKMLFAFFKDQVLAETCKAKFSSAGNALGVNTCRPRLDRSEGRIKQLTQDWRAAKMDNILVNSKAGMHDLSFEVDSNGVRRYSLRVGPELVNFSDVDLDRSSSWDQLFDGIGKRQALKRVRPILKRELKDQTHWFQYLKRRNLRVAYLRDLGLPGHFFLPDSIAKKLDDLDAVGATVKGKIRSKFRSFLAKHVVSSGQARVGALLDIIISNDPSEAVDPAKMLENSKAVRLAAEKLGEEEVIKLIEKYGSKTTGEISAQIIQEIVTKIAGQAAGKAAGQAAKAIPVIGQIMLVFTLLDILDMVTDGTLSRYLGSQNSQVMLDTMNLFNTVTDEEKRGFVDLASAGDMRIMMITGLSQSRLFAEMMLGAGGASTEPDGYKCRPDVDFGSVSSLFDAGSAILTGDPGKIDSAGMEPGKKTCENHRVDYDPLESFKPLFDFIQNGYGPYKGLSVYTEDCVARNILPVVYVPDIINSVCKYSTQDLFHDVQGGIGWITSNLDFLTNWLTSTSPIKEIVLFGLNLFGSAISILVTGQDLVGPESLSSKSSHSGAKIYDANLGGSDIMYNSFARGVGSEGGLGAVPLSGTEARVLEESIASDRHEEMLAGSLFDRFLDFTNPDSVGSGFMASVLTKSGASNIFNPAANLNLIASGFGNSQVFAESPKYCPETNPNGNATTSFGTVCNGYTDKMIDDLSIEDIARAADPEWCKSHSAEIERVAKESEFKDPDGTGQPTTPNICRLVCTVTDSMGTAFREDDKVCGDDNPSGSSSTAPSTTAKGSSAAGSCAAGTTAVDPDSSTPEVELTEAYSGGARSDITLCTYSAFPSGGGEDGGLARFSAEISANVKSMVDAAKAEGVSLSASSSFRSMAKQTELYACAPGCTGGNPAAKPGYSNHQGGKALDFSSGSPSWVWMKANSEKFGLKWYGSDDPVHWSTTGG